MSNESISNAFEWIIENPKEAVKLFNEYFGIKLPTEEVVINVKPASEEETFTDKHYKSYYTDYDSLVEEYITIDGSTKMIYTKINGQFTDVENIGKDICPILDKYLFDFRCDSNHHNECEVDYMSIKKEGLPWKEDEVVGVNLILKYNQEDDKFSGSLNIESTSYDDINLSIDYDEINHCMRPNNPESNNILNSIFNGTMKKTKTVEEKASDEICNETENKECDKKEINSDMCECSFTNLQEPNDTCVNCAGFKDCWLGHDDNGICDCEEECNDECECIETTPCNDEFCPTKYDCNDSISYAIYKKVNKKFDEDKVNYLKQALTVFDSLLMIEEKYRVVEPKNHIDPINWIIIDTEEFRKLDYTLPDNFMDLINKEQFEDVICEFYKFKEVHVVPSPDFTDEYEIHCRLI